MAIPAIDIVREQQVLTRTPDGKDLAFLTGTARFQFKGTGGAWRRLAPRCRSDHHTTWACLGWGREHRGHCVACIRGD
jgi:hypothetical protein